MLEKPMRAAKSASGAHQQRGVAEQAAVFAFLQDPATHGLAGEVTRVDTHAAAVFLAGPNVYKVKRAVRFPFMDQSTLERRRFFCEAEVAVNSRFTPDLYLGVVPIAREAGRLAIGGDGEVVEWAVHLRRFDETKTLDLVAERGQLTPPLIAGIARLILESHQKAEVRDGVGATAALAGVVEETLNELTEAPEVFPADRAAAVGAAMRAAFASARPLLLDRGAKGRVRRCHGDLHLRNIALLDRGPVLFDAIEFDETIATTDVLYDLAFALMDMIERRLDREANHLLNRYLWGTGDVGMELAGLATLPLFISLRAAVRAKIAAIRFREIEASPAMKAEALRYLEVAIAALAPKPPVLIALGGLSGSGKSTIGREIAAGVGRAPGAVHIRSDIERKRMLKAPELEHLPPSAYRMEVTSRVFAALRDHAGIALRAGQSIIVDAVHLHPEERQLIEAVATDARAPFIGLWLEAPEPVLIARVTNRTGDASDAMAEVVALQLRQPVGEITWTRIDASGSVEQVAAAARAACA
jgi:aminoglycoside phosphotransferase family enzyme/predicted kinase